MKSGLWSKLSVITVTVGNGREEKGYCLLHNDIRTRTTDLLYTLWALSFQRTRMSKDHRWRPNLEPSTIPRMSDQRDNCSFLCATVPFASEWRSSFCPWSDVSLPLSNRQMLAVHRLFEVALDKVDRQKHSHLHRRPRPLEQLAVAKDEREALPLFSNEREKRDQSVQRQKQAYQRWRCRRRSRCGRGLLRIGIGNGRWSQDRLTVIQCHRVNQLKIRWWILQRSCRGKHLGSSGCRLSFDSF